MKVLECEAKTLLRQNGLPVPDGYLVASADEAKIAASELGDKVVLKAQIPSGGRMKAGGVHFVDTPLAAASIVNNLIRKEFYGFIPDSVLVEEQIEPKKEVFLALTYDTAERNAVALASLSGGIDIEKSPNIVRYPFSTLLPISDYSGREISSFLGFQNRQLLRLGSIISSLIRYFILWDALLLELNPLILDRDDKWWIADVHLEIDDDAAYRQRDLFVQLPKSIEFANRSSDFERRAAEIDNADHRGVAGRLIAFEGDLGLLIGGGGASLTIFDAVLNSGLKPANYCEIGGNPSVWKVKELTKLILSQPNVKYLAVIMNVVSNTRVDLVARGVIKGVLELKRVPKDVILAFRLPGSWEDEGVAVLNHYGVPFYGRENSIDQVVEQIKWPS